MKNKNKNKCNKEISSYVNTYNMVKRKHDGRLLMYTKEIKEIISYCKKQNKNEAIFDTDGNFTEYCKNLYPNITIYH